MVEKTYAKYVSPNGDEIVGTLETLQGKALVLGLADDGEPEYLGETEVFWDEQKTVYRDEKRIYVDVEGYEWTFDQLKKIENEEVEI